VFDFFKNKLFDEGEVVIRNSGFLSQGWTKRGDTSILTEQQLHDFAVFLPSLLFRRTSSVTRPEAFTPLNNTSGADISTIRSVEQKICNGGSGIGQK